MLKIATFNVAGHGFKHGPWEKRLGLLTDIFRKVQPDILVLQAVEQPRGAANQAEQLAARWGADRHVVFRSASEDPKGLAVGLAIVARWRPIAVEHFRLSRRPGEDDRNERIALAARFRLADGPLTVFNTHFSPVAEQAVDNVAEALPFFGAAGGERLVLGDMGSTPDSAAIEALRAAGWQDVWGTRKPHDPGFTFESDRPRARVDYVWASPELAPHVADIALLEEHSGPQAAIRPSDHLGLAVTLDRRAPAT